MLMLCIVSGNFCANSAFAQEGNPVSPAQPNERQLRFPEPGNLTLPTSESEQSENAHETTHPPELQIPPLFDFAKANPQSLPTTNLLDQPIRIAADYSQEWTEEESQIAILRGRCEIVQGNLKLSAQQMVVWKKTSLQNRSSLHEVTVYLEGNARLDRPGETHLEPGMTVTLATNQDVELGAKRRLKQRPSVEDPFYAKANVRRHLQSSKPHRSRELPQAGKKPSKDVEKGFQFKKDAGSVRRIRLSPRSAVPYNLFSFESKRTVPSEQIVILTGGVNLIIEGLEAPELQKYGVEQVGAVDLSADSVVIWTQAVQGGDFQTVTVQPKEVPLEIYLEGNIVLRQGTTTIRAEQAIYNDREKRGLLLNAEMRTFIPKMRGNLRVRADQIRQLSMDKFHAKNAWTTGSQMGKPSYRIQSSDVYLDSRSKDTFMNQVSDSRLAPNHRSSSGKKVPWIRSVNNTIHYGDLSLMPLKEIEGPLQDPNIPLRRVRIGQDSIFGFQAQTSWDFSRMFGWEKRPGTDWLTHLDFYSRRGPHLGTEWQINRIHPSDGILRSMGEGRFDYQFDQGQDNLGRDRSRLPFDSDHRYRGLWRHRFDLPHRLTFIGELGFSSDRNYREQYVEGEFDHEKDAETLAYLKQDYENLSWSVLGRVNLDDFETSTNWLPKGDLTLLSEPLFNGLFTWSSHTVAGYAQLRPAALPDTGETIIPATRIPDRDMTNGFTYLPNIADAEGAVFMTRHELDMPFQLGLLNISPYLRGEAAFFEEGMRETSGGYVADDSITRLVGTAGLRGSIMFWKVYPHVQSDLFNLNGLAHKIQWGFDYSYTDSTEPFSRIPQYNEIDDNNQERFRERLVMNSFGGLLPNELDPRRTAIRMGAGADISSPYFELVDDLHVLRTRLRQRLQTKVGPPDRQRVFDWMTLDLEASFFPEKNRDNFGESFGLISGHYRWNISDRTSFIASGMMDPFENGQRYWNLGLLTQRSQRGTLYLGIRQVEAAELKSRILTASFSYKMSPRWYSTLSTAYDLAEGKNRGQSLTITRVYQDFMLHFGFGYDSTKDNIGIAVSFEPLFGALNPSSPQLHSLLNVR